MKRAGPAVLVNATLVILAALTLVPLAWMISASLMPAGEANQFPPPLLPSRPTLDHYRELFTRLNLGRNFLNSLFVTVVTTAVSVMLNAMAGYAFAKLKFRGRDALFHILLGALVIPTQVGMLPLFLLLQKMGFLNTMFGVMVPYLCSVFGIFMVRQYALSIPDDLLDAARIDGASEKRIFWEVVLPVIQPILAVQAAFNFLATWNDFLWPLIVLSDEKRFTLPVAIASLVGEHVQDTELMMAGAVLTVLPVVVLFLALQRFYVEGVMMGSTKG
ncbi:MAG: carbohydrate ABC transporter permease [Candidatus Eisenbacteria bacterium]|uniref:Carbohydrate ABC transporter permease n=1 Tax=Eiseniibacteriota bacterium TaxID=2212470 RepID=A0A849SCM1_UNCEI|nr:carbohydrate ABC transporter permease [Candidatus Eisenbacteria bacterium]